SPVFLWLSKKDQIEWQVLIDQRIVAIVKEYCEQIGLDPSCFAAHSTRFGYVTSCSERGVPISEMMKRTRHKKVSSLSAYMKSDELIVHWVRRSLDRDWCRPESRNVCEVVQAWKESRQCIYTTATWSRLRTKKL